MSHFSDITEEAANSTALSASSTATLAAIEAYWQSLCRGDGPPDRLAVQTTSLDPHLSHTFVAQRVTPGVARIRVAGQNLHNIMQMDPHGMPLSAFLTPDARTALGECVETAFMAPALVEIGLVMPRSFGRSAVKARLLLMPLRARDLAPRKFLGTLIVDQPTGNRPCRFELDTPGVLRCEPLTDQRGLRLLTQTSNLQMMKKGPSTQRPALRLVVNNS